jgi:Holliday junction resolvase RusA-like endonuclease
MLEIKFTVFGDPVAQGRPRFARRGNFVTTYDPKESRQFKDTVYSVALQHRPPQPMDCALELHVVCYRQIPSGFSKKKAEMAELGFVTPTTKPDVDNYAKGVKDALRGVIWTDDSRVVRLVAEKKYSRMPRTEITVRPVQEVA